MNDFSYIKYILNLPSSFKGLGLDYIKKYLNSIGNPQNNYKVFHITGTNGKGSVSNMLYQTLYKEFNYKVGIFTSPHLLRINERFQINGQEISDKLLNSYFKEVIENTKNDNLNLSYFEICTLVAIKFFSDEKVDYSVIEVGIGGSLDSTNVFSKPLVTYITSISKDHTNILGKSLSSIQKDKMGIIKPGVPIYTPIGNKLMINGVGRKGGILKIVKDNINTNLNGLHQKKNASLVYNSLVDLGFDKTKILKGLNEIEIKGRLQFIENDILIDGSHNEGGIKTLKVFLNKQKYKKLIIIFGTTRKIEELNDFCNIINGDVKILTKPSINKAIDPVDYKEIINGNKIIIQEPKKALEYAKSIKNDGDLILIYGSMFLIGDILKHY